MSLSETTPRKTTKRATRDVVALPALFVIVLVECLMNAGIWRFLWPLLAVSLLSRPALKAWACVLLVRVLLATVVTWSPLDWVASSGFLAVRTAFVWIMFAQNKLLATNRLVQRLGATRARYGAVLRKVLIVTVTVILLSVVFFTVPQPYVLLFLAALLVYVLVRIPRPAQGADARTKIGLPEVALFIVSLLICLGMCELSARLLMPAAPVVHGDIFRPHPRALFCLAENGRGEHVTEHWHCTYAISDQGLRDRSYGRKDKATYRILCLGDSMTMGLGVSPEETYPKALERALAGSNLGKRVEVINAGTVAYGVWQELILLEEKGFALDPDLVILQLVLDNDIRDELLRVGKAMRSYDVAWQIWVRTFRQGRRTSIGKILSRHSRAFTFAYSRYTQLRERALPHLRARFRPPASSETRLEFGPQKHAVYPARYYSVVSDANLDLNLPPSEEERPFYLEPSLKTYYPEIEEGWELMEESISEMATRCRARGVDLLVFSAPMKYEVYPDKFDSLVQEHNLDPNIYDLHKAPHLLRELCQRNGLDYVETLDRFMREGERNRDLFLVGNAHWARAGNALCAEILRDYLLKTHLRELVQKSDEGKT